jgi:general secretion pathway protein G
MRRRSGFTLIEVVVVIAVISILASMAVPYAVKAIDSAREESTKSRMLDIYKSIMGDPSVQNGGYVGDMGQLPANLAQLNTRLGPPVQPVGTYGPFGIKFGWFGNYVNTGFAGQGYTSDAWGRPFRYGGPAPLGPGQISSAGADGNWNTADDITYPPAPVVIGGNLLVNLYVWDNGAYVPNPQPAGYPGMTATVTVGYSQAGTSAAASSGTAWNRNPPYSFPPPALPLPTPPFPNPLATGFHSVTAACTLPPSPARNAQMVVYVPPNNQQAILNLYLK